VWYGVSFFLSESAVRQTMRDVALLSAPGSTFVWDYLDTTVVDGTTRYQGALRARTAVAKRGEPYTFGLTSRGAEDLLNSHGFGMAQDFSITELARRYGGDNGVWFSIDDFFGIITGVRTEEHVQ
jgi:O-methyltransferase involved in polyketide biosynthesis